MMYPDGVITRPLTAGGSVEIESGEGVVLAGKLVASHGLIWVATGERMPTLGGDVVRVPAGEQLSFTLPVTDQGGYRDEATGLLIDVSTPDTHTHTYTLTLWYERGGRWVGAAREIGPFPLPTGDGSPVDADLLIEADTVPGLLVSVPDAWSAQVAQAVAAAGSADAAASSAGDAAQSAIAAGLARDGAVTAQGHAETAQGLAEDARDAAATSAGQASTSAGLAAGSASSAAGSAGSASTAAGSAASSASAASGAASAAAGSATAASGSATAAQTARTGAETALSGAQAARTAAETAQGAASASASAAAASAAALAGLLKVGPGDPRTPSTTAGQITGTEPNGCTYRSTDGGGVGGYLWTKRAGVWVCVEGDTGRVPLASRLINGYAAGALLPWVRRIGSHVYMGGLLNATGKTSDAFTTLPIWAHSESNYGGVATSWATSTVRHIRLPNVGTDAIAAINQSVAGNPIALFASWPAATDTPSAEWPTTATLN